jgi:hypothetical protein
MDFIDVYLIDDNSTGVPEWLSDTKYRVHNVALLNGSSWVEQCIRRASAENHSNDVIFIGSKKLTWNSQRSLLDIYNIAMNNRDTWDLLYLGADNDDCEGYTKDAKAFDPGSSMCNTKGLPLAMIVQNSSLKKLAQAIRDGNLKLPVTSKIIVPHPVARDLRVSQGNICRATGSTGQAGPTGRQIQTRDNGSSSCGFWWTILFYILGFILIGILASYGGQLGKILALVLIILLLLMFWIDYNYKTFT